MKRKFFGIPIEVSASGWFLVAVIVLTSYYEVCHIETQFLMFLAGWFLFIALFSSLLIHALAHCLTARAVGAEMKKIKIIALGVTEVPNENFSTPKQEFLTAIAGPASSLTLAGFFSLLAPILGKYTIFQTLGFIAYINTLWGLVNLIPAFPTDGGRIIRAILWQISNIKKATIWTTTVTFLLSAGVVIFAIYEVAALGKYDHIWPAILASYIALGAVEYRKDLTTS